VRILVTNAILLDCDAPEDYEELRGQKTTASAMGGRSDQLELTY
jgi:hypothetical protein